MNYTELVEEYGWDPSGARKFAAWSRRLDRILLKATGLGIEDGPDFPQADYFESGMSPESAAQMIMDDRGYVYGD